MKLAVPTVIPAAKRPPVVLRGLDAVVTRAFAKGEASTVIRQAPRSFVGVTDEMTRWARNGVDLAKEYQVAARGVWQHDAYAQQQCRALVPRIAQVRDGLAFHVHTVGAMASLLPHADSRRQFSAGASGLRMVTHVLSSLAYALSDAAAISALQQRESHLAQLQWNEASSSAADPVSQLMIDQWAARIPALLPIAEHAQRRAGLAPVYEQGLEMLQHFASARAVDAAATMFGHLVDLQATMYASWQGSYIPRVVTEPSWI